MSRTLPDGFHVVTDDADLDLDELPADLADLWLDDQAEALRSQDPLYDVRDSWDADAYYDGDDLG
jgi:hypothetical protein